MDQFGKVIQNNYLLKYVSFKLTKELPWFEHDVINMAAHLADCSNITWE